MAEFPELFVEFRVYAMTPTVSSRAEGEGVHALVSRIGKNVVRFHLQLANALLRQSYVLKMLEEPQFHRWALRNFNAVL